MTVFGCKDFVIFFEVFSVRAEGSTLDVLDVRIDPTSIGAFKALSAAQLGLQADEALGGRIFTVTGI